MNKKINIVIKSIIIMIGTVGLVFIADLIKNLLMGILGPSNIFGVLIAIAVYIGAYFIMFKILKIKLFKDSMVGLSPKCIILFFVGAIAYVFFESIFMNLLKGMPTFNLFNMANIIKVNGFNYCNNFIYIFLLTVVLAPIFEEVLFRGYILKNFLDLKINPVIAIVVSAMLFGIFHMNLAQGVNAFVYGLISGVIYLKFKNVNYNIIFHLSINIITFILMVII